MLKQRYGSVPSTSHHCRNSSVPNWLVSVSRHASSGLRPRVLAEFWPQSKSRKAIGQRGNSKVFSPRRPFFSRPYAVHPMVRRHKIAARISHHRYLQLLQGRKNILAESGFLVRQGASWFVESAIDAAAYMSNTRELHISKLHREELSNEDRLAR